MMKIIEGIMNFCRGFLRISEKGFISRRKLEILAILAILLVVPLTVLVSQQQQETRQRASERTVVQDVPAVTLNSQASEWDSNISELITPRQYTFDATIYFEQVKDGGAWASIEIAKYEDENFTRYINDPGGRFLIHPGEQVHGSQISFAAGNYAKLILRAANARVVFSNITLVPVTGLARNDHLLGRYTGERILDNTAAGNEYPLGLSAGNYRLEGIIRRNASYPGSGFGAVQIDTYINRTLLLIIPCPGRYPTMRVPATETFVYCRTIGFNNENAGNDTYSGGVDFRLLPQETAKVVRRAINANVTMQNVRVIQLTELPTPTPPAGATGFLSLNKETCPLSPNCRVEATWYYTNAQLPALEVWYSTNVSNKYYQRVQQNFGEGPSNARTFTLTEPGFYTFRLISNRSSASPTTLQEKTVVTVGSTTAAPTQTPLPTTAQTLTPTPLPTVTSTPTLPATSVYCGRVRNPTSTTSAKTGYVDIFVDDVRNAASVLFTARLNGTTHIYNGVRQGATNTWKGRVNMADYRGIGQFLVDVTARNGNNSYSCGNGNFTRTEEGAPAALEIPTAPSPTPTACQRLNSPPASGLAANIFSNSPTNTYTFSWGSVAGATRYLFRIRDITGQPGQAFENNNVRTNSTTHVLSPGRQYEWWVHAVNACGYSIPASYGHINPPALTATSTPTSAPVIGDVDGNRCLDNRDFYAWQNAYNQQQVPSSAHPDLNNDGRVDLKDYNIWYRAKRDLLGPLCQP